MKALLPQASDRRLARVLGISRVVCSGKATSPGRTTRPLINAELREHVRRLVRLHPTYGYRRIWAVLRFREGLSVNRKAVQRVMQLERWQVRTRPSTPRPRVEDRKSQVKVSNTRWALDMTHVPCGDDGWGHLVAVIDCADREVVGWEFALRGRASEAEKALEAACLHRFGTVRPLGLTPTIRSDNGLIFQARRFRKACRFYRLRQEYITPYTPEQNGLIERFFRSLKEECVWQHNFRNFEEAYHEIAAWIRRYNTERPHQALGYLTPVQFNQQLALVA